MMPMMLRMQTYVDDMISIVFVFFIKINLKERTKYMENINKVPSKIIEIETSIKLFEYLKRKNFKYKRKNC